MFQILDDWLRIPLPISQATIVHQVFLFYYSKQCFLFAPLLLALKIYQIPLLPSISYPFHGLFLVPRGNLLSNLVSFFGSSIDTCHIVSKLFIQMHIFIVEKISFTWT